jgi:thiol-disulfide isomerase/thioredoxin
MDMKLDRRYFLAGSSLLLAQSALAQSPGASARPFSSIPSEQETKAPPMPLVGSYLKLAEVPLFDGSVFRPSDADGHILVIYWWASYCPFCAQQSPEVQKLWDAWKNKGLKMLTLSFDSKPELATQYLRKTGFNFPAGFVTPEIQRVMPKPRGVPITLVRGRDGKLLQAEKGQLFPEDVALLAQWI